MSRYRYNIYLQYLHTLSIQHVIHLGHDYPSSPAWQFLVSLHRDTDTLHTLLLTQTTDQVTGDWPELVT